MGGGSREEKLLCSFCHQLPKVVLEAKCCFSIFCKNCVLSLMNCLDGDCPNCGKSARGFQVNVPLQKIVNQQDIKCRFQALGCEKTIEFKDKEEHEENCPFASVECPNKCSAFVKQMDLKVHKETKCSMRIVQCSNLGCEQKMPLAELEIHKNDCKYVKIQCNFCFNILTKNILEDHIDNTCPEALVSCPYYECGCCEKIPRKFLLSHLDKNTKLHLQLVFKVVGKQQREIALLKRELNDIKQKKPSFVDSIQDCADNAIDSIIQWFQQPERHPKVCFNFMYLWFVQFIFLLAILYNGFLATQQYLIITSYLVFVLYFKMVQQTENVSWFLQLVAYIYFNAAWIFLVYIIG